jgi:hypothetical protein
MKKDLNFWLKWIATSILIIGTAVNSLGFYPIGPLILIAGGLMWLLVSVRWKEPALIVTNGIMTLTAIIGVAYNYFFM